MEINYDIWFSNEGKVFDEKCFAILQAVEETGSLNKAAQEMNLPYCSVFRIVRRGEEKLGFTLLERRRGGSRGGGSRLTPKAKEFMARYKSFNDDVSETVRHIREGLFEL
ncbi:MAG: Bacterial regulatory helix-turn-helix protein, lysR family [Syntrophorhabdus sp. PtaU1.Bin002]|nr:MAG: Bacterial regulatory helix-turn-helix protein, lysR family [Syntrophorhabdus sp. PtaB.Bin006]OPY71441.1 MAG: Bacterial regulatory helix-turn-helix protein, lysR family [Syntrophorhabdus sp. PtaU1.Bin002]